jgi:dTDP-4-dehydrorhamnose reductase
MILITGANGVVGSYVNQLFPDAYAPINKKLDISNKNNIRIQLLHYSPDIIINCASMTDLEICEKNPIKSLLSNSLAPLYLSEYASDNALIIHISTGQVFGTDGKLLPGIDHKIFRPTNMYALSKYYGEVFLDNNRKKGQTVVIIRTSCVFGNNGNKFIEKIIPKLKNNEDIYADTELRTQITYAKDLALFIKFIVNNRKKLYESNVFHFTNTGTANRYEIAQELLKILNSGSKIIPVEYKYFKSPVIRPSREYISIDKTEQLFPIRSWQESIYEYANKEIVSR